MKTISFKTTKPEQKPPYQKPLHEQLDHYLDPPNNLIWIDKANCCHFDIPGLLKLAHIEDTPANRVRMQEFVKQAIRKTDPGVMIIERAKPD